MARCAQLLILAFLLTTPSQALIFDQDDRTYSDAMDRRFDPIGLIRSGVGIGTGFLIDDCHALTSRHLISEDKNVLGATIEFRSVRRPALTSRGKVIAAGKPIYKVQGKTNLDRHDDWMLIKMDVCIGRELGFMLIDASPIKVSRTYQNAGYPVDRFRHQGLSIDPNCTIHFVTRIGLLNDCAFLPGNSGGPIFDVADIAEKSKFHAVAIGSTGYREKEPSLFSSQTANVATPIAPILPVLRQFIDVRP